MNIISIILLLWRIIILSCCYGAATTSAASAPIAKPNCTTHCGDVAIPFPFGIGPNEDCYLDEWFQIDCSISFPFNGFPSVRVKNLTGSPFNYSRTDNIFIAVSCDLFVRVSSDHETIAGCQSICRNTTGDDYNNCYEGIGCCRDTLLRYELTSAFSIEIPLNSSTSDPMGDCKYAFLVETDWFENNLTNFQDLKDMGSVPVVLDWILNVHNYGERFSERFREKPDLTGNQSTPFCTSSSDLTRYNRTRMICACPPGLEGNPYLLQPF